MHLQQCWSCPVDSRAATYPVEVIYPSGKKEIARMCSKCRDNYILDGNKTIQVEVKDKF